ncbi:MAG: hypothetical protein PHT51_00550 [Patescibacteria group bacterium]|nr:hypothetical protein [Patescibacteria group bacterium]MDD4610739.1 hypothetical protein [Patescibacteria group bacterium]
MKNSPDAEKLGGEQGNPLSNINSFRKEKGKLDSLEDIKKLKLDGYFVSSAKNIEVTRVFEIKAGEMNKEETELFSADAYEDFGKFFTDRTLAEEYANSQEIDPEEYQRQLDE